MLQRDLKLLLQAINSLISKVHTAKSSIAAFRRISNINLGKSLELKACLEQRFTGAVATMERLLEVWECLEELFVTHCGEVLPLRDKKFVEQFCGLLKALKLIHQHAQDKKDPATHCFFQRQESRLMVTSCTSRSWISSQEVGLHCERKYSSTADATFLSHYS